MRVTTSAPAIDVRKSAFGRAATALEVLLVYAGILLYIWHWQATHPHAWIVLLGAILLSHVAHRDTLRTLGLSGSELRASARIILPLMLLFFLPMLAYGFARHVLTLEPLTRNALKYFAGYGLWCAIQQYLTQSYFHNRLMNVTENRHLSAALVGLMFGSAHIPNPILMPVTALAGFIFAEIFARHRNIWPLALAQTVGGFLVAAISPAALIHNMRVGPGYFFYGLR